MFRIITQVSTQGYPTASGVKVSKKDKCWVESYKLAFSTDGSQWQQYTENGVVKVRNSTTYISGIQGQFLAVCFHLLTTKLKKSLSFETAVCHRMHVLSLVPRKKVFFFSGFSSNK